VHEGRAPGAAKDIHSTIFDFIRKKAPSSNPVLYRPDTSLCNADQVHLRFLCEIDVVIQYFDCTSETLLIVLTASRPGGRSIHIFYDPTATERVAIVRESLKWHDAFFAMAAGLTLAFGSYSIAQARQLLRL
jgi:hypothetical protein